VKERERERVREREREKGRERARRVDAACDQKKKVIRKNAARGRGGLREIEEKILPHSKIAAQRVPRSSA
jgi:hypothetical protein